MCRVTRIYKIRNVYVNLVRKPESSTESGKKYKESFELIWTCDEARGNTID
jgi:hypothetical protein